MVPVALETLKWSCQQLYKLEFVSLVISATLQTQVLMIGNKK